MKNLKWFFGALLIIFCVCACTGIHSINTSVQAPVLSQEQIASLIAKPDRTAEDRQADIRRKPAELLTFIGTRPAMVVLDISAGGGYTTELLARAVGPNGHVYGQSAPADLAARVESETAAKPDRVHVSSPEATLY